VLNRNRRILFVNRAWEEFTGLSAGEARGLVCKGRGPESAERLNQVARVLSPPLEVLEGNSAHARRPVAGLSPVAPGWWDIEFFPLRGEDGVACILGKITGAPLAAEGKRTPFPEALKELRERMAKGLAPDEAVKLWSVEKVVALRERFVRHFRLDLLDSPLPALRRVAEQARLASAVRSSICLVGEAGTGKAWLARAIHQNSPERERAFAHLDCARVPAGAIGETLFGSAGLLHRPGIGTIYLSTPSHLPQDAQLRLHDWLERWTASSEEVRTRIISGSDASPLVEVRTGRLLEKLYAVLSTLVIELPPLRERLAEMSNLVDHMLCRLNEAGERRISGLTPAAWETLLEYRWPGNLSELFAVLAGCHERAIGERIDAGDLPASMRQAVRLGQTAAAPANHPIPLDSILEQVERRLIEVALRRARGNKSRAAEILSVWRPRLLRRMEALGIEKGSGVKTQESGDRSQGSENDAVS
jgi:transcriptional regulator of acetoin/glycerol metabolism